MVHRRLRERQITADDYGHILTNIGCWSPDSQWLYYDTRSDASGSLFDGRWIERVHVQSGLVERLYESPAGSNCGVVTASPVDDRIVFIHGPEPATPEWPYAAWHRRGVILDVSQVLQTRPSQRTLINMDAMCYDAPLVPGALRGGSHVHTFDGSGQRIAFTYEDHLLAQTQSNAPKTERNQRNVGISVPRPVRVPRGHPRNHDGEYFSVLVTRTSDDPRHGSDEVERAYEDAWVGDTGYRHSQTLSAADTSQQQSAIAFIGDVRSESGQRLAELFIVDIPNDLTIASDEGPLEGTLSTRPRPPRGTQQRRLTFTANQRYPGLAGPRHWPRSTPDGSRIFFLMHDEDGIVQVWSIAPSGGSMHQVTRNAHSIASAFSVSSDGSLIAYIAGGAVCVTEIESGKTHRLTDDENQTGALRPEACVFSPDGKSIAYVRNIASSNGQNRNQLFVVDVTR